MNFETETKECPSEERHDAHEWMHSNGTVNTAYHCNGTIPQSSETVVIDKEPCFKVHNQVEHTPHSWTNDNNFRWCDGWAPTPIMKPRQSSTDITGTLQLDFTIKDGLMSVNGSGKLNETDEAIPGYMVIAAIETMKQMLFSAPNTGGKTPPTVFDYEDDMAEVREAKERAFE